MNEVCLAIVILRLHIQGLRTWHFWINYQSHSKGQAHKASPM